MAKGQESLKIKLSSRERQQLESLLDETKRGKRAEIILASEGATQNEVAEVTGVTVETVRLWQGRFVKGGIESLGDAPRSGRPHAQHISIELTDDERTELTRLNRRHKSSQALALRARIILACAEGLSDQEIATQQHIATVTAKKWRVRFVQSRMDGLRDESRPGAKRTITDEQVEEVVVKTLESLPQNETHWSTRGLARRVGMSQSSVSRIWRAFGLQPQRVETFKLSNDPYLVEKVRDIVGLYLNPPERAVVLCVDEKSQIQALERSQPILPFRPGEVEKVTHDYLRHGTTTLFAALDTATGKVIGSCTKRHRAVEFRSFLNTINRNVPKGQEIHLIIDNYGTHKAAMIHQWLLRHPRFTLHFTPTYASWMNLVERFFAEITNKRIRRGSFRNTKELEDAIKDYLATYNENPRPFVWTKTADQILDSIKRVCERINDSVH